MTAYFDQMTAWSEWALKQIEEWDDTTSPAQTWATRAREIFTTAANPPDTATSADGTGRSTR